MPRTLSWVGPALLVTALVAQQGPPDSSPPAPSAGVTAAERLAALQAEQKKVMADYQAKAREAAAKATEAKEAGQPVPAMQMRPDFGPLLEQALAAASDYAGTDDAVPFLLFAVRNSGGKPDSAVRALEALTGTHVDHAAIADLGQFITYLPRLVGEDTGARFLERLAKSKNPDVRGWATYARHLKTIESGPRDGDAYKVARAELQQAAEGAADAQLKEEIRGSIETREKYGVGNTAPDIEGTDLDGVAFKLSDYKGKVVFLDFWGDW